MPSLSKAGRHIPAECGDTFSEQTTQETFGPVAATLPGERPNV